MILSSSSAWLVDVALRIYDDAPGEDDGGRQVALSLMRNALEQCGHPGLPDRPTDADLEDLRLQARRHRSLLDG